ncbi:MAG: Ppx/GppA family phosphatase [Dehalococcoidia bacterium]|nr:Ppx/GppA family phosphatase [Dehalococcoidia bacterium]
MAASSRIAAVVDVGSNSIRLLVARELSDTAFEVIDEERSYARLGEGQVEGVLTSEGMARGTAAMRVVAQVAAAYEPSYVLAAGTEALRRAPNAGEFVDRVRDETGITIRVLSADEEAHASYLGTVNSTMLRDGAIVDIGGGSLELIRVRERAMVDAQSVPLGAIYATEKYFAHDPPTAKEVRALRKAVRQQLEISPEPVLFGVGGAVRNLARIVRLRRRYPLRRLHGLVIEQRELARLVRDLLAVPSEGRRRIPGVAANRADILPAAAVVIQEVMLSAGAERLEVSGQGLREGLAWQQLRGEGAVLPDVRAASVGGLAAANGVDGSAAEHVAEVAGQLFDATRAVHELDAADRELLMAAARIAGIGMHVDYYNRDRHAEYLVHSGDLHGFTHREIVLLGALVRWAGSGSPDLSLYKAVVTPDDARRVTVLAALLGTAAAIRRRGREPVECVGAKVKGGTLVVKLRGPAPIDAELAALERQQKRLEGALKMPVSFTAG